MSSECRDVRRQRPPDSPVSQEMWDRLVAAGIEPATKSSRGIHHPLPQRPDWLAFLVRIFRRRQ
jgi:hypothetical protein